MSADSRQIYRGLPIGTAAPTTEELAAAPHHFVASLELDQYYSAACYEEDALRLLDELFRQNHVQILCGGSMMYVDAVCNGIDRLPTVSDEVRRRVLDFYNEKGLEATRRWLQQLDPVHYGKVDLNNPRRVIHAIEICLEAGLPYSELLTGQQRQRPFRTLKFALDYPRDVLFDRINRRVDRMIAEGLEAEARRVYPLRHLNSLNTVGYKEMFALFEGRMNRETAIARLAKNTRVYAKKQLTWLRRDPTVHWLSPSTALPDILNFLT